MSRVWATTPLHTALTRPLALSITNTVPCALSGFSALRPLPRFFAVTGTETGRSTTGRTACTRGVIDSAADSAGGVAAITESSTTRCAAPLRSVQLTVTLADL